MKKLVVTGFSLLAISLVVLGTQTNVVGYETVQASQQNLIKERINQKDILFQTICDIVNNKDIQKTILISQSGFLAPFKMFFSIKIPTITKRQVDFACRIGLLLSKTIYPSRLQALGRQFHFPNDSKEILTIVDRNPRLKNEMKQLSSDQCHCGFSNFTWSYPLLCNLVLLPPYLFCLFIILDTINWSIFTVVCFLIAAVIYVIACEFLGCRLLCSINPSL